MAPSAKSVGYSPFPPVGRSIDTSRVFVQHDLAQYNSHLGAHSLTWTADMSKFPNDVDGRCMARVLFGPKTSGRVRRLVLGHPRSFICAGVAIHVLGIGSMSPVFVGIGPAEANGHIAAVDYVWTVMMPLACAWHCLVFAVSISGYNWIMLQQFKPLYILVNSAIFSLMTFSYFFASRGYFELTAKVFDVCAFTGVALSDSIPGPLRGLYHRYFLPVFMLLYALAIFPRLYNDVDENGRIICYHFGSERLCNTTLACQVLVNLLTWWTYIAVSSMVHPGSFRLLNARVNVSEALRRNSYSTHESCDDEADAHAEPGPVMLC